MKAIVMFVLLALCACDSMEANKRMNFDVCDKRCTDRGTTMKKFEQGLGYVTCECSEKKP